MCVPTDPLTGPIPPEIPLEKAPLVRVICQIRYPMVASVENRGFIGPFQEAIRNDYPTLRPEDSRSVVIGPKGAVSAQSNSSWRFSDSTKTWRVTLAPDFLALETTGYMSREDFLNRLRAVLTPLGEHVKPGTIDRLGIRYIDRIVGENLQTLPELVRPEVSGIMATSLAEHTQQSIAQSLFHLPDGKSQLHARWGRIPANSTVDPSAVKPVDEPSWILDIDAFVAHNSPFEVDSVLSQTRTLAQRVYSFFRWVVTDEFHLRYGGKP